jgi:hypothetical protein
MSTRKRLGERRRRIWRPVGCIVPRGLHHSVNFNVRRKFMTKISQTPDARITWPAEHAPASAMVFAQNVVDIVATPQAVWSQLIDCVAWPQWYKLFCNASAKYAQGVSVPGHALRCGPEISVTSPLRWRWFKLGAREDISPVVEAVGMCESRREFQRVWEGWEAGFMAFHAFHTLSFPWLVFARQMPY